ncbi:MAG TPA: DUF3089 domain-containing protein, partial [Terriglobales bacterium]|nr:DUF3089 domain-containing protein [Terriglobales bacterium]
MRRLSSLLALAILAAAACGTSTSSPAPSDSAPSDSSPAGSSPAGSGSVQIASPADWPTATGSAVSASAVSTVSTASTASGTLVPDDTVWLCKPGLAANPCEGNLDATPIDWAIRAGYEQASPAADPPIDCFYVYPTVSRQKGVNADLTIDVEETDVAIAQAARFSQVCRVYAPMYPQITLAGIATPSKITYGSAITAYSSLYSSFRNYMANFNHGRGIVFVGHSQGAMMLTALLKNEVDPKPEVRRLLVSALLMGGNVTVPAGKSVGGDFANIPACSSATQTGCVVGYSSFDRTPPADAVFGRIATAISPFGRSTTGQLEILCVNPAAPGGGTADLQPYF